MVYRDLGGIKNKEGKMIQNQFLFRSADLSKINGRTVQQLNQYHLHKIIDLRTDQEVSEKPNKSIAGAQYIHIPVFNTRTAGITHEKTYNKEEMLQALPDNMESLYKSMVTKEYSVAQLKRIIHEVIDSDGFPILFHCTAGKDRTGLVAFLLLSILDVSEEEIVKDYLHDSRKHQLKSLGYAISILFKTKDRVLASKIRNVYMVDKKYLMAAMQAIKEKYGSTDAFIKNELNVSNLQKEEFKAKILK